MAPRGRPAVPKAPTKFLNSKRRTIYMTADGKYIAKSAKGATVYGPKARFVKSPGGTERNVKNSSARVPTAIRAKAVRKVRSNKYKARPNVQGMGLAKMFASPKRPVGRPRKMRVSPMFNLPNPMGVGMRRVRKNKGMKRGPRGLRMLANTIAKM